MDHSESSSGKESGKEKAAKAKAQVGTWVVPMSTCEGAAHQPAPKAKKRKRLPPLSVRATDKQRAAIKAKATKAGLSVNQYMLLMACGSEMAPLKPSPEDRIQRAGALRAYRGTGNLLNQIARHLNSGRIIGSFDIAALLKRHQQNADTVLATFIKGMPDEKR